MLMVLLHSLLDSAWSLILLALLSVSLIVVLVYGLLKAYGNPTSSKAPPEDFANDGEQQSTDIKR